MTRNKIFVEKKNGIPKQNNNCKEENKAPEGVSTKPDIPAKKNIESIMRLEKENVRSRSTAEHLADKITTFAGSTASIIFHIFWFGGWIIVNVGFIPGVTPFDHLPFSFLTLIVSLEAIFLTLLVLMSQNRMTIEADKRAHLDLQINMLAEQEGTTILRVVQKIGKHLGLEEEIDEVTQQLSETTDVDQIAKTLKDTSPE